MYRFAVNASYRCTLSCTGERHRGTARGRVPAPTTRITECRSGGRYTCIQSVTAASRSKRLETLPRHCPRLCPLTATEIPWALNLPPQQSLAPLPPDSISCSCNTALNINSAPALSPCLPGRCSCSCNIYVYMCMYVFMFVCMFVCIIYSSKLRFEHRDLAPEDCVCVFVCLYT